MSQRTKIILFTAAILIIGSGVFAVRGVFSSKSVPREFIDARATGAVIAENIVDLANQTKDDLANIEIADRNRQYGEAVRLVESSLDKNREARDAAIGLSLELQRITQVIPDIKPTQARLLAIDAVNTELTLVSHLITHNDYLFQLLGVLGERFSGDLDSQGKVGPLIQKVNLEITAINDLNKKFTDIMIQFDALTR